MGSGDKFQFNVTDSFGIGFRVSRFPHKVSIDLQFLVFTVYIGFGKGYDEI